MPFVIAQLSTTTFVIFRLFGLLKHILVLPAPSTRTILDVFTFDIQLILSKILKVGQIVRRFPLRSYQDIENELILVLCQL